MNARITISIPVEKVHLKVADLLEEIASELEISAVDITAISKDVQAQQDFLKQIEQVDKIRKKISLLDANLEDCYSILNGLINLKSKTLSKESHNDANITE